MASDSKGKNKIGDNPAAGQAMPSTDKQTPYYPSYPAYPSYPSYGAPPPPPQQGCPVVSVPPYYPPYGGCAAPAPPPPPPPPPLPHHHQHQDSEVECLSRCLSFFLTLFLFLFIASLLLRLLSQPYIPEVAVSTVAISGYDANTATQVLSAKFDVVLDVSNPRNDAKVYYSHIGVALLYDEEIISYTRIPSFEQDRENTTAIEARMAAEAEQLEEETLEGMESERIQAGGEVTFRVRMFAWVRFASVHDDWWTKPYEMNAYCEDVRTRFRGRVPGKVAGNLAHRKPASCVVTI